MGQAAVTLDVTHFGAVGDGQTDDAPAIRRALAAAQAAGPGATLTFPTKTFRLGPVTGDFQLALSQAHDLAIEGNGASLVLDPRNGFLALNQCSNVTVRGFSVDYDPLPFTQGVILQVNARAGTFDFRLDAGFPLPPTDALVKQRLGKAGWDWGSVMDARERHVRWDVSDHFFVASVNAVADAARVYRVQVAPDYVARLAPVRSGDWFVLPLRVSTSGVRSVGDTVRVTGSTDCRLEQLTLYAGRNGMDFAIIKNQGRITLKGNRVMIKPGTERLISTWRDGMHCKNNRIGPCIEDCRFEGMLDDSINLSADTAMAARVISDREFQLVGPSFAAGDRVLVFDPARCRILAETRVARLSQTNGANTVVLADAATGVTPGRKQPHTDIRSTQFYNLDYVNAGFIVRGCTFLPQRRHAILVRGCNGLIESNRVDGIGGSAVSMGNELGSFYEGPFPHDNLIRGNVIENTRLTAIQIYSRGLQRQGQLTHDIQVVDNQITLRPGAAGIVVESARRVTLTGNRILDVHGQPLRDQGVQIKNASDVRVVW